MTITEERDLYAKLVNQRDEALGWLSQAEGTVITTRAERDAYRVRYLRAAWILGSAVVVLVIALVWAVIA